VAAPQSKSSPYTGSTALIEALHEAGITHLFANFGQRPSGIVEALAEAQATGKPAPRSSRARTKWSR
jgi:hypothetical protein